MERRDEADRVATRRVDGPRTGPGRGEAGRVDPTGIEARPRSVATSSPWVTAAWLAVPVLAGAAQVLRGAWGDALIFLVPAVVLAADAVGLLPRARGAAARLRRLLPPATVVVGAVLVATPRHGVLDALAVAALGFGSDRATAAHPVISDLLDPVADEPAGRLLLTAAWVLTGLALLRRGRRR